MGILIFEFLDTTHTCMGIPYFLQLRRSFYTYTKHFREISFFMEFKKPPVILNEKGEIRRVGFELEFAGVDLQKAATVILQQYGGEYVTTDKQKQRVNNSSIGDFCLNVDLRLLSEKKYTVLFEKLGINLATINIGNTSLDTVIENVLESGITTVIPYEISAPSLPITELHQIERLRQGLQEIDAKGTKSSILYAFAMHINPELPEKNVQTLLAYTRAFVMLYPWLFKVSEIAIARRISSFINPFPAAYIRFILDEQYAPQLDQFIDDYYLLNPDRNRPLDLYPVFAWLNAEKVNGLKDIGKVSPRPTFHYRLPNSLIDDPDWTIAQEWNRWVEVEKLACDPGALAEFSKEYLRISAMNLTNFEEIWINKMEEWMQSRPLPSQP